jgi:hypothetical protein
VVTTGRIGPPEPLANREPGHALSRDARQRQRSLEGYVQASIMPRYMERLREIHDEMRVQAVRLEHAYRALQERHGADTEAFRRRWLARVRRWRFDTVNELISQHNEYYPMESGLPLDPRTRDYVRPYLREPLDADWILERFPP